MHLGIHKSLMKRAGLFRAGVSKNIPVTKAPLMKTLVAVAPRQAVVVKPVPVVRARAVKVVAVKVPAVSSFVPSPSQRAPMVRPKPGAFMVFKTTPTKVVRTPITPAPVVPVAPQKPGFDVAKILPLAIGAGAALLMMRG